ncbi:hypothetical protein HNR39_000977 [Glaciimonas immobilis]|uniref:Uncharacterized protein n=1 Tax=Glaciimonas immobilis TaxID=728004 RepID=A0A840RRD5_9BURK|nr:hypothetical protein [Glaciimonas immobilis]
MGLKGAEFDKAYVDNKNLSSGCPGRNRQDLGTESKKS